MIRFALLQQSWIMTIIEVVSQNCKKTWQKNLGWKRILDPQCGIARYFISEVSGKKNVELFPVLHPNRIIQECLKPWRQKMMRDRKALNDYQSKQTVVFLIGYSTTLVQGFIASLPSSLTSIKFLMLLIHMDETYQKHHHPFEVQINCNLQPSFTSHSPAAQSQISTVCCQEKVRWCFIKLEFRFLSEQDFFHSCYVDVLDYESIPTTNNSKELLGQKKPPSRIFTFLSLGFGVGVFGHGQGDHFPPRHANGLNELPLRGVIIPGMNDFFKPNDSGTAGTPTILRSFYPPPAGPEPNLNLFVGCKNIPIFQDFWHGGSRDVGFRV